MSSLALVFCFAIFAQKENALLTQKDGKRVQKVKIAEKKMTYCNEQAELSSQEAEAYWMLRNKVDENKKAIKQNAPKLRKIDLETASEAEIKKALEQINAAHAKADQVEAEYLDQFIIYLKRTNFKIHIYENTRDYRV